MKSYLSPSLSNQEDLACKETESYLRKEKINSAVKSEKIRAIQKNTHYRENLVTTTELLNGKPLNLPKTVGHSNVQV